MVTPVFLFRLVDCSNIDPNLVRMLISSCRYLEYLEQRNSRNEALRIVLVLCRLRDYVLNLLFVVEGMTTLL
jgi:hypothetical protein